MKHTQSQTTLRDHRGYSIANTPCIKRLPKYVRTAFNWPGHPATTLRGKRTSSPNAPQNASRRHMTSDESENCKLEVFGTSDRFSGFRCLALYVGAHAQCRDLVRIQSECGPVTDKILAPVIFLCLKCRIKMQNVQCIRSPSSVPVGFHQGLNKLLLTLPPCPRRRQGFSVRALMTLT